MRLVRAALLVAVTGCATAPSGGRRTGPAPSALPEPLRITVVYPDTAVPIEARDSSFLFGNVGHPSGDVTLTVDGRPVPVQATGAWLAWVPLPDDSIAAFRLVARTHLDSQVTVFTARIAPIFRAPPAATVWIDTTSFTPIDTLVAPAGEGIRLAVRAAPGAGVRLRMEGGVVVAFVPDMRPLEPTWGARAFGTDSSSLRLPPAADRYVAWFPAAPLCDGILEVSIGADTARAAWPLFVDTLDRAHPAVVELNDDTAHTGLTDSLTVGKAVPYGTYNWFFPLGTTAVVSGRWNDQVRLQLSRGAVAWVNAVDGPVGATGPTGLWEPVATLAVALKTKTLLERAGATVLLTRTDSTPVELFPRTHFAEQHDADVLVSIHANALPDGVNPFTNNGTSVYYFHPRSAALARALDRALVLEVGVRDLGMGRGDYALVRNPWMPSALTEGLFMMIPEQEAMLASDAGQWRYARGVARGIEDYLRAFSDGVRTLGP